MSGFSQEIELFIDSYLADPSRDRVAAARVVWPALSRSQARQKATSILRREDVQEYALSVGEQIFEKLEISLDKVYLEIAKIAFADPSECYSSDGALLPISEIPAHILQAIPDIEVIETSNGLKTKVKFQGKLEALKLLVQLKGGLVERKEISGPGGGKIEIDSKMSVAEATEKYMQLIREVG